MCSIGHHSIPCNCIPGVGRQVLDMAENINISLILEGKATIEDLYILHGLGYEFVVEGGAVTSVLYRRS